MGAWPSLWDDGRERWQRRGDDGNFAAWGTWVSIPALPFQATWKGLEISHKHSPWLAPGDPPQMVAVISFAQLAALGSKLSKHHKEIAASLPHTEDPSLPALRTWGSRGKHCRRWWQRRAPLAAPHSGPAPRALPFQDGDGHYTSPAMVALLLALCPQNRGRLFSKRAQLSTKGNDHEDPPPEDTNRGIAHSLHQQPFIPI